MEAEHKMTTRIKLRRDTAANWTSTDPILAAGEPGLETDTGKIKYGDGATAWAVLKYADGDRLSDDGSVLISAGSTEHWFATQRRDSWNTTPRGLRYDSQGNLYALTKSGSNDGNIAVITKYNAAGAVSWQKTFTDVAPMALAVDSSDRVYITLNSSYAPTITVIKFNTAGSIVWKKEYDIGPVMAENAFIEEKNATTMVLAFTGVNGEIPAPNLALVMVISAADGTVQIKKQIAVADQNEVVVVTGIDTDSDENVFVTGYYYATDDKYKMFVEKLDENLDRVWNKSLETPYNYNMYGGDCASDALGNIYVVGTYNVDTVNSDGANYNESAGVLVKLNASGTVQWTRRIGPGPCGSFVTGLTTDSGNVYLAALTFSTRTDGPLINAPEWFQEGYGQNKMVVACYNPQGAVSWQRYVDVANLYEQWDSEQLRGQAIAVFGNKFAVDGYGWTSNTIPFDWSGSSDDEYDYFVVQLPTDGTELTIGNLGFTESRVPGRFVTHTATNSPLDITAYSETVLAENSTLTADDEPRIANNIVKSEIYTYTFGADGTLTLPNDGDLKLTQSQVGYLMAVGGSDNNNSSVYGRAVAVDSQGNMYVSGEDQNSYQPFVMKINPGGDVLWGITIQDDNNGNDGRVNGINIHPTTGNVMVVCEMYDNYTYSILVTLDQDTGRILTHEKFSDADSDVYLIDIAYTSDNNYVLAGSKFNEFSEADTVTKQTGSGTGIIKILRSDINGNADTSWKIGGTGIDPFETISYVNHYTGLLGTVRQGSGATFYITIDGSGAIATSGVTVGGINYLPGHKILLNGSPWDGSNIIVTVTSAPSGVIDGITVAYDGASNGVGGEYSDLSGTNYQTGSGLELTFDGPRYTNNYADYHNYAITSYGSNYVENDIIIVAGALLDGATPANNLILRASVDSGGVVSFHEITGTAQSTIWKLSTTTQVDFAQSGSWAITRPLDRQNLLVTPTWQRTFGTSNADTDRLYAVTVDSENNIITVGEGYGELDTGNYNSLAMVYKFNSTGTLQWARQLNEYIDPCYAKSVITIGTDVYVTHRSQDFNGTVISKLDSTGTVKWQRGTNSSDDSVIARTADGNLLVSVEAMDPDTEYTALKVFLLTPSGETIYKRWLFGTTDSNTQFKNGRGLAVDGDSYYITAYFYANSYNSSLAARLPVDGSGTGEYSSFRYTDVNAMTGSFMEDGLYDVNYSIPEIDIEDTMNYAGPLANGADPYVNDTDTIEIGTGDFYLDTFFPELNVETVIDTDGGSIVFADGSKQSTSATDIPQRLYTGQRYTLGMQDRGHHILCVDTGDTIIIPYNARVEFPIGTVITLVNISQGDVYISQEGSSINLIVAGMSDSAYNVALLSTGIATLLKISYDGWIISGNVEI